MRPKHFLNFEDYSKEDLVEIINRGIVIKNNKETSEDLNKKTLALVCFKNPLPEPEFLLKLQ